MDPVSQFFDERRRAIGEMGQDEALRDLSGAWMRAGLKHKYSYNFTWLGRPIIQYPQDIVAMQEIIWQVKPDLIVETGIAHGGSLMLSASMLELIGGDGGVVGIDIDIREHNRDEIEKHPMFRRIELIEGSSIDPSVVSRVSEMAADRERVLVVLDSDHRHEHVLRELQLYSPLVTVGSYLVVFDTIVEDMPDEFCADRPWGRGNSPRTAVREFLQTSDRFEADRELGGKLLVSVSPDGYLKCVKA
jgi:cephalosporin hydroxylase